jgi:hypothetical protein
MTGRPRFTLLTARHLKSQEDLELFSLVHSPGLARVVLLDAIRDVSRPPPVSSCSVCDSFVA